MVSLFEFNDKIDFKRYTLKRLILIVISHLLIENPLNLTKVRIDLPLIKVFTLL